MSTIGKLRPLPPDLWTDEDLIPLPVAVKWTAIGLRMHADDQGRESTTDWMLRPSLWPRSDLSADDLVEHLIVLHDAGYIGLYSVEGRGYYALRDWPPPSHPRPSKHPAPPPDAFRRTAGGPPATRSAWEREGEGEGETRWQAAGTAPPPFCPVHMPNGTDADCRHCGTRRMALDLWKTENGRE